MAPFLQRSITAISLSYASWSAANDRDQSTSESNGHFGIHANDLPVLNFEISYPSTADSDITSNSTRHASIAVTSTSKPSINTRRNTRSAFRLDSTSHLG